MARIRTIKPEFWTSEQVVECSIEARLLFVGIWTFADDAGIHPASTKRLKMEVFPADDYSSESISRMVVELIKHGLLVEYKAENETFWQVTGWKHQKIDKPTYKYPRPTEEQLAASSRTLDESSPPEWNGMESNGEDKSYLVPSAENFTREELDQDDLAGKQLEKKPGYPVAFETTWGFYPKRSGGNSKPKAFKAWKARIKQGTKPEVMHEGVLRYAAFIRATGRTGTEYVKQAATFFGPDNHFMEPWEIPTGGNHATHSQHNQPGNRNLSAAERAVEDEERWHSANGKLT